ncbi:AmmeMemoRadiSam system protein B, partial [Candidatus Falkowbacteria bacterium CG23_combo_of_CG06-09_8_20_14_all_41_10]
MLGINSKSTIRPAAVAGQFYPASRGELERVVAVNLEATPTTTNGTIKMIIVPHAGYEYSAGVAALAYKALAGQKIKRVYLLGNSHHDYFSGLAIDNHDFWETPLGRVPVDTEKVKELITAAPLIKINNVPHGPEHDLEVQLPFLQTVLGSSFKIVPLLFGNANDNDYEAVAKILTANFADDDLIVISSDLSHYPSSEVADKIDHQTLELIANKDLIGLSGWAKDALSIQNNEQT